MNFYFFKTTAVNDFNASARTVPCNPGVKGVLELIGQAQDGSFDTSNWDELKAIERTILQHGKEREMLLLTSESSYYGKKYRGITWK